MSPAGGAAGHGRIALLLGVMFFFGSAFFYQDPEWNGNSRLNLTRAIVEQGTLRIDDFHTAPGWATGDKAFYQGHYYSDKAIGSSLLAVPVYFVLYELATKFGIPLGAAFVKHVLTTSVMGGLFALCGVCMYAIASRIAHDAWIAVLATLGLAFGTMLWPYSAVFYGHIPVAAFLVLTFALLMPVNELAQRSCRWQWFWIGLAIAMAFICDFTSALVIPGLAAYALHALKGKEIKRILHEAWPALPGMLVPWTLLIGYNLLVYAKPLEFGYSYEVEERFQEIMGLGLMGMRLPTLSAAYHISLDPKFGLLWLSPVILLVPLGYWVAFRECRHCAEVLLSAYAFAVIFLMNAASYLWYGGSTFGPRLLISALPFLIVPLAMLPRRAAWALAGLGALSSTNMLIPLMGQIQYTRLEFDAGRGGFLVGGEPFRGFSLLYGYGVREAIRLQRLGQSPWTLGSALGFPAWLSISSFLGAQSALFVAVKRRVAGA